MKLPKLTRKWTIHLIHHTHTDIGYTDHQKKIERFHVDYIKQAIEIFEKGQSGEMPDWKSFRWTVECFWSVEVFLMGTDASWHERLKNAVLGGGIELGGTYLHWNELIDQQLSQEFIARGVEYGRSIGVEVRSAISSDINGFGWGFADSLLFNGIENFLVAVHSRHGLPPLGKRQMPFFWESPGGGKLLVWSGEHYMMGNFLGLVPRAVFDSCFKDELTTHPLMEDNMPLAVTRLGRYLEQMEADGYPYDFLPIGFAGIMVDNAPPNPEMCDFIGEWNKQFGNSVELIFSTPSKFFSCVRAQPGTIESYSGDWPDWWSDGVGSTPVETRIYRETTRDLRSIERARGLYGVEVDPHSLEEVKQSLALFAEHTFSHNDSTIYPWQLNVQTVSGMKRSFAHRAYAGMVEAWDQVYVQLGQGMHQNRFPMHFKVINPSEVPCAELVEFYFDYFQLGQIDKGARIVDVSTGLQVPHQMTKTRRGVSYWIEPALSPGDCKTYEVEAVSATLGYKQRNFIDTDVPDVAGSEAAAKFRLTGESFDSPHVTLHWDERRGVTHLIDVASGKNLLDNEAEHGLFTPVYRCGAATDPTDEMELFSQRDKMGRNRTPLQGQTNVGKLQDVKVVQTGELFAEIEFTYAVEGCAFYKTIYRIYSNQPRIDASIRLQKQSVWQVENLYASLPFDLSSPGSQLHLEKAGAWIRPWQDQLPDTLTDFYCVQSGFTVNSSETGIVVASPDAPLLQLGSLDHQMRKLAGNPDLLGEKPRPYSWLMNNVWEVNFDPCLAGFHEFRYSLVWGAGFRNPGEAKSRCQGLHQSLKSFQVKVNP